MKIVMNTVKLTGTALGVAAGFAVIVAPQTAQAAALDAPLTGILAAHAQTGWTTAIARTDKPLTPGQQAQLTALGADVTRHLPIIHSVALRLPTRHLGALAALPFVTRLSLDGKVQKCDEFTVTGSGAGYAYTNNKLDGYGVVVAVIDSGVHSGDDLNDQIATGGSSNPPNRIVAGISYVPYSKTVPYTTSDACGHGTHVAGIIAGNGYDSTGTSYSRTFYGVARRASIVNVRVLDSNGQSTVSQVISGLQWVVANKTAYKIRVINLSLGHSVGESYTTDPLCQAVEAAWKAGIVVVCAAGNNGRMSTVNAAGTDNEGWGTNYGSIASPGNDPYIITVGATKNMDGVHADDKVATYSSRGPSRLDLILKPDLVAPGNRVISVFSKQTNLAQFGNNILPTSAYVKTVTKTTTSNCYFTLSGTSMATPVVSGAVALMLQSQPNLTPDTVKARLMFSADKMANWADASGNYDACTCGAGYVNVPAALASTVVAGQPAMSPSLSTDSSGNCYININNAIWGKNAIWGTGIGDLHAIWGKNAIWGNNTLADSHAIWGKSVWSDHAVWGTTTDAVDLSSTAVNGE